MIVGVREPADPHGIRIGLAMLSLLPFTALTKYCTPMAGMPLMSR
jgi:hypothetical protein